MGKRTKRSGRSGGDSLNRVGIVSPASSAPTSSSPAAVVNTDINIDDEFHRRKPPALRSVAEEQIQRIVGVDDVAEGIEDEEDDDDDYEDVYESSGDEYDDGEEAMAVTDANDELLPATGTATTTTRVKAWNPFLGVDGDITNLEIDETAYKMHHALTPEWPSLTLDVVPDRKLGDNRTRFPHTVTLVVGSQADVPSKNKLSVLRMSDLCRVPGGLGREKSERELDDEMLGEEWKHEDEINDEDEDDESSDDEDEEEEHRDPILEHYTFPHSSGGINRVRICPHNSDIVAAWGESGLVSLYDIGGALDLLDRSAGNGSNNNSDNSGKKKEMMGPPVRKMRKDPFFVYSGHSSEGYALDWSRVTPGKLATADVDGNVHIWDATHPVVTDVVVDSGKGGKGGGVTNRNNNNPWGTTSFEIKPTYSAHGDNLDTPSVEDLQWSPTESTVLASGECGGYVRIYDTRCPGRAMISNKVHANGADVNVIAWSRLVGNLLASGGDDGTFSVWDLRNFRPSSSDPSTPLRPLARFRSHRTPITSLEWHPTDESMIAVSDDRGTYIYDLSIEEDDPDSNSSTNKLGEDGDIEGEIPPQLLFVHSGSEMTKEVRWHPQIPSCVATTSLSGFSIFIPSNL